MSVRVKGTTNLQEVDSNGYAYVNTPITADKAGFTHMAAQVDAGTITGVRYYKEAEITDDYRLRIGQDNLVFNENFVGTVLNTGTWVNQLTTMTNTITNGFTTLNAGLSVASGALAVLSTRRSFPAIKQFTTFGECEVQFTQTPQTNNVCEWGFFQTAATTPFAPTDGCFFRLTATGEFRCIVSYNGTETQGPALNFSSILGTNITNSFLVYIASTSATFWVNNIMMCEIDAPAGQASICSSMNVPLSFRNYNSGATSLAQVMKVGNTSVVFGDHSMSKPWGHVIAGMGGHSAQTQTGSATLVSTALVTNAATTAAAALSNTTPSAGQVGLGGFIKVLPTLTAGTDGILCSYQVPLGTSTMPGRTLYITGVSLDGVVTTIFAGGPVIYAASVAYGHTAASLATTESATSKAPRRVPLGMQSYAVTAPVGAQGIRLHDDYTCSPIPVYPGEFIAIALRNFGTVTTTGDITFCATFTGYWE
jgi:hypothetical protein